MTNQSARLATCPTCGAPFLEARVAIKDGLCPICGRGPYRVPLSHIARVHKIDRREARRLFGIAGTESACDPAHSARARAAAISRGLGTRTNGRRGHVE